MKIYKTIELYDENNDDFFYEDVYFDFQDCLDALVEWGRSESNLFDMKLQLKPEHKEFFRKLLEDL